MTSSGLVLVMSSVVILDLKVNNLRLGLFDMITALQGVQRCLPLSMLQKESLVHNRNIFLSIGIVNGIDEESNEVPRLGDENSMMIILCLHLRFTVSAECLQYLLQQWTAIPDLHGYGIVPVCSG